MVLPNRESVNDETFDTSMLLEEVKYNRVLSSYLLTFDTSMIT